MSNVVPFPRIPRYVDQAAAEPDYTLNVYEMPNGFDWSVTSATPVSNERLVADLAAIALSLCPPKRTFIERLRALILGD